MKALCSECFFEDHIGHDRKMIKKVYEEGMKAVGAAMETLDLTMIKFENKIHVME